MARSTRSAATERAYLCFAPAPRGAGVAPSPAEEFHESDIWGALTAAAAPAEPPRARGGAPPAAARKAAAAAGGGGRAAAAHGSLPVNIPDWSKILGEEYRGHHHGASGDWEVDDADDEDGGGADAAGALVPPHELAWRRRRAASLSVDGAVAGRTLKVRDAVWKRTTGFQD